MLRVVALFIPFLIISCHKEEGKQASLETVTAIPRSSCSPKDKDPEKLDDLVDDYQIVSSELEEEFRSREADTQHIKRDIQFRQELLELGYTKKGVNAERYYDAQKLKRMEARIANPPVYKKGTATVEKLRHERFLSLEAEYLSLKAKVEKDEILNKYEDIAEKADAKFGRASAQYKLAKEAVTVIDQGGVDAISEADERLKKAGLVSGYNPLLPPGMSRE